jgi:hypothetical protein
MKNTRIGLFVAAALWALPVTALAQEADEAAAEDGAATEDGTTEAGAAKDGEGEEEFDETQFDESEFEEGSDAAAGGGADDVGDICKIDPAACPVFDMATEAAKPMNETILAVQQRFIIKNRRFEIQPYWGVTLNDQFVSHPGIGLALNYYITEVMAVGINGQYYQPFNVDSDFNAQVRRAAPRGCVDGGSVE